MVGPSTFEKARRCVVEVWAKFTPRWRKKISASRPSKLMLSDNTLADWGRPQLATTDPNLDPGPKFRETESQWRTSRVIMRDMVKFRKTTTSLSVTKHAHDALKLCRAPQPK